MDTTCSTNRKSRKIFASLMSILAVVAIAFPATQVASAGLDSPFLGQWQATDVDESEMHLTIAGRPTGPFQITWTDQYISFCSGEAGIVRGTGWLNDENSDILESDIQLECFATGATLDFHVTFLYHPATNTLSVKWSFGQVTIWYRPGRPQAPPPTLNLRVNYGHDWVESFYEGGHMVWITVTESDGVTVKATAELVTEPKDYWGGETGFQSLDSVWFDADGNRMENPPDIQPNNWVFGWVDNGASVQVQIGDITGAIDLPADSIEGTIYAPWFSDPVQVECLDWGSGGEPFSNKDGGSILANGTASYSCSWAGEWDIQAGQTIGVGYFGPDGNWVSNAFSITNPTFVAYLPSAIEGYDWPMGDIITININDGEFTAQAISEQRPDFPEGETRVLFELWRDNFTFEAGDHIVMMDEAAGIAKEVVVTNLAVTDFNLEAGTVSGTYNPANDLWVWLYGQDGKVPETTDPENGTWTATFAELPPGAWGGAVQHDTDGDGTSIDFQVPEPILWAAAYTFDLPAGYWNEGEHTYHFEAVWNGGSETTPEVVFNISDTAPFYDGYVLLRGLALRASIGGECPVIDPIIQLDQATRFLTGYVTDYPMTFAEAQAYFDSLNVRAVWDDGMSAELIRYEIIPYSPDDWLPYVCTYTSP